MIDVWALKKVKKNRSRSRQNRKKLKPGPPKTDCFASSVTLTLCIVQFKKQSPACFRLPPVVQHGNPEIIGGV